MSMNATIFNEVIVRKELCSIQEAKKLNAALVKIEKSLRSENGDMWIGSFSEHFRKTTQMIQLIMGKIDGINRPEVRKKVCPDLSLLQIKQIYFMYNQNCSGEYGDPVPEEVMSQLALDPAYKVGDPGIELNSYPLDTKDVHWIGLDDVTSIPIPEFILHRFLAIADKKKINMASFWNK